MRISLSWNQFPMNCLLPIEEERSDDCVLVWCHIRNILDDSGQSSNSSALGFDRRQAGLLSTLMHGAHPRCGRSPSAHAPETHMATLRFLGTDFRNLIDTLHEAVKLARAGERSSIEVNSIIYRPGDLAAIAALMPEGPLSVRHQVIVDAVTIDKPDTYRAAAAGLARLADTAPISPRPSGCRAVGAHPRWHRSPKWAADQAQKKRPAPGKRAPAIQVGLY
jgi:hypothetical protein